MSSIKQLSWIMGWTWPIGLHSRESRMKFFTFFHLAAHVQLNEALGSWEWMQHKPEDGRHLQSVSNVLNCCTSTVWSPLIQSANQLQRALKHIQVQMEAESVPVYGCMNGNLFSVWTPSSMRFIYDMFTSRCLLSSWVKVEKIATLYTARRSSC